MSDSTNYEKSQEYKKKEKEAQEKWAYYYRRFKKYEEQYGRGNSFSNIVSNLIGTNTFQYYLKKGKYGELESEISIFEENCKYLEIYLELLEKYPKYKELETKQERKTKPDGCFPGLQSLGIKQYILESKKRLEK